MKEQSTLGKNLTRMRKQLHLTQSAVADALGIERSRYAHYENRTMPSADNLKKLAAIFNVSIDDLICSPYNNSILFEGNNHSIFEEFIFNELKPDEKGLILKYRLLSPEAKETLLKQLETKIEKSEK